MVHALTEAHRVLAPGGYVIEYRPERDPGGRRHKALPLCCRWAHQDLPVGDLRETDESHSDYVAAARAVRRVLARGVFDLMRSTTLYLRTHIDTLPTLDRFLTEEWTGTTMPDALRRRARTFLRRHPGSHLVVKDFYVVNVLRKR